MSFTVILTTFITAVITDNIVLSKTLGICPFLGVSKKTNSSIGMGLAVIFVLVLSSLVCFVIWQYLLVPFKLQYLQTIIFILIIAALVQILDIILKKFTPGLYDSLGVYLALITTNCAVLGTARTLSMADGANIVTVLLTSLFIGIGFLLALLLMSGIREKLDRSNVPHPFRGFPIALIVAGIMSMAFMGFFNFSF